MNSTSPNAVNYRPLPDCLTIKPSSIDKLGLFATAFIKMGADLGITHIHRWEGKIRTPLGGFINHSIDPNCKLTRESKSSESRLVTTQSIQKGEELTLTYQTYLP